MTKRKFFTPSQLSTIDSSRIPHHVALIPDGNRRWAKKQQESHIGGHRAGANVTLETIKAAKELGIKVITSYFFSTENWSRSPEEIAGLMWLLQDFLTENCQEMQDEGVRFNTIGHLSSLSSEVLSTVQKTVQDTAHCNEIDLVLALNYGGRDEIRRAIQSIVEDCHDQKIHKEQITESLIATYLDTAPWGDPNLLIRTSGEMRISNFLLWQLSYTEIYVTDVLWPDFTPSNLLNAVIAFQKRERRLGGP